MKKIFRLVVSMCIVSLVVGLAYQQKVIAELRSERAKQKFDSDRRSPKSAITNICDYFDCDEYELYGEEGRRERNSSGERAYATYSPTYMDEALMLDVIRALDPLRWTVEFDILIKHATTAYLDGDARYVSKITIQRLGENPLGAEKHERVQ